MIEIYYNRIKTSFGNLLEEEAEKINNDFKDLVCIVYDYAPNSKSDLMNIALGLDVVLHNADIDKADNLCMEVYMEETESLVMNGKIVWGHPTGKVVASIFQSPMKVNNESLSILENKLPDLISKFRQAIKDNPNGQ